MKAKKVITKFITKSAEEMQDFAVRFAEQTLRQKPGKSAVVLGLKGDLGAGKTTFLQGFAKGLKIKEVVNSPTFVVMKKFQIPNYKSQMNLKFLHFYHLDCYRLNNAKEILQLGFMEIILNPENIVAIEWPEKVSGVMPKDTTEIKIRHLEGTKREIFISLRK